MKDKTNSNLSSGVEGVIPGRRALVRAAAGGPVVLLAPGLATAQASAGPLQCFENGITANTADPFNPEPDNVFTVDVEIREFLEIGSSPENRIEGYPFGNPGQFFRVSDGTEITIGTEPGQFEDQGVIGASPQPSIAYVNSDGETVGFGHATTNGGGMPVSQSCFGSAFG